MLILWKPPQTLYVLALCGKRCVTRRAIPVKVKTEGQTSQVPERNMSYTEYG